jgi:IMP dehydrogenase
MEIKASLTVDDVLLTPKYSEIESRKDVDLSVDFGKGIVLDIPIISANMKNITEHNMAKQIALLGGMAILHRFCTVEEQGEQFALATQGFPELISRVGVSVGVKDQDYDSLDILIGKYGARIVCVDVAHSHSDLAGMMTKYISDHYKDVFLISGNIATPEAAEYLERMGANAVKIGVGGGSICTTRIETGCGVPTFSSVLSVNEWRNKTKSKLKIISDGSCKSAGDIVKLCAAGADAVMVGNLLSGTDETPSNAVMINGVRYKEYNGSSTFKTTHIEGVKSLVPIKGPVADVINRLADGIRSGCSYQGVLKASDLKNNPEFVKITNAGLVESKAHDVMVVK